MYTRFFNLAQLPFSIAPDPRYLYMSGRHREALAHLLYGIDSGGGFVLLTGEIGAGKTTVCRCFLEQIPPHCKVAYIFNPKLTVADLLQSVCDEFGIAPPHAAGAAPSIKSYVDALNAYLLAAHAQGRNNLLIIDEAQNLSADVLEQLRLLTNLETSERKLLQVILIGQPELRAMLAGPGLEQLAQRVIARYHLGPLEREETARYIAHRLAVAGMAGVHPFRGRTLRQIHRLAGGVPRRINLLCDRALLGAYAQGRQTVDTRTVARAAREVFGAPRAARRTLRWRSAALAATVVAGAAACVLLAGDALTGKVDLGALAARLRGPASPPGATIGAAAPVAQAPLVPVAATAPQPASDTGAKDETKAAAKDETKVAAKDETKTGAEAPQAGPSVAPDISFPADGARSERDAWLRLARSWGAALPANDPCGGAPAAALRCYRGDGGLAELRQLDRPAVLALQDGAGQARYALLTGLTASGAQLDLDGKAQTVSLVALGRHFRGSFGTLWHAPQAFREQLRLGDRGAEVDWIAAQLARQDGSRPPEAGAPYDQALAARVREFQAAHGLEKDGVVGPKTFMHLNIAAGLDEPRLSSFPAMKQAAQEK